MTILPFAPEGITIVTGHYGCGKTNLALNYALDLAADGLRPTIVDLDVVNPYFRSSDYTQQLLAHDIHVIAPNFAGSTLDTPSLSPAIAGCIEQAGKENPLILDVGGDDAGATALGQYADAIKARPYHMPYVVNRYRDLGDDVDQYVDVLHQIEQASHLQVTGIVDNSNLMQETLPAHITGSLPSPGAWPLPPTCRFSALPSRYAFSRAPMRRARSRGSTPRRSRRPSLPASGRFPRLCTRCVFW